MLRIYCLQQWYALSDPGAEEALYEIHSMRRSAVWTRPRRDAGRDDDPELPAPSRAPRSVDGDLRGGEEYLKRAGLAARGTIVDATIIAASPSTKNSTASAIRRCIRRRRAISGTSA